MPTTSRHRTRAANWRAGWTTGANACRGDADRLLPWLVDQPLVTLLELLVLCSALSVNAMSEREVNTAGDALAAALGIDMAEWRTPTAGGYLAQVPKARIAEAVTEAVFVEKATPLAKLEVGPKALDRFERDVIERTGVTQVIMLIGINDIGFAGFIPTQAPTVDQITTAVQSMIDRAKARGIKVYVSTLTPFKGTHPPYYSDASEAKRVAYNAFVRADKTIDGLIDFEVAVRDPADPTRMLAAYDSGDHLHPNDAGYQAMANAIDLSRFKVAP